MKSKVVLQNAIRNLTRMNGHGSYTEKIAEYQKQLDNYPKSNTIHTKVEYSLLEKTAIQLFCQDGRFSITE